MSGSAARVRGGRWALPLVAGCALLGITACSGQASTTRQAGMAASSGALGEASGQASDRAVATVSARDVSAAGVVQHLACAGAKPDPSAPTIVLMSGLGRGSAETWEQIFPDPLVDLPARACTIDRAGVGDSPPRDLTSNSPAANANETLAALSAAGEAGPYIFVGWSYGGLVALLAANQAAAATPPELAGLVLIDPTLPDEYRTLDTKGWKEGGVRLDMATGEAAAADISLGDAPVVVVIAGQNTVNVDNWAYVVGKQTQTAERSDDFLVVDNPDADHDVTGDDPDSVLAAVRAAVEAASPDVTMPGCADPPDGLGAPLRCLASD